MPGFKPVPLVSEVTTPPTAPNKSHSVLLFKLYCEIKFLLLNLK